MGLELWCFSNDSPPKARAIKRDALAEARSSIRRRNAPPVIRRTIDLSRLPSATFISPSVRDALRAAEVSRRPRSVDIAHVSDVLESEHLPADQVSARREADATDSRLLGMESRSRPARDSSRNLDENALSSDRNAPTRTTSTGSMLRRARSLLDSDGIGLTDAALIAAARPSRMVADDMDETRDAQRRAARRRQNERHWARANARARSSVTRPNHWESPGAADFPPLRRMGRRQVTDGPAPPSGLRHSTLRDSWSPTNVDGLGDRERSVSSPPSDHWETMLTTITPDAQLPSADSSFTSAAASASFSTSNTSQTGTHSSRSASDDSTPTELTEPSIDRTYEEQLFCETEDDMDSDDMIPPSLRPRDRGHSFRRARLSSDEPNHHWAAAPSPPARNPGRYADAHSRLREITSIIRNYQSSGSRSQSPRSGNDAGVDRLADPLTNDDRRDSATVIPNVSRPGSARDEQDPRVFPDGEISEDMFLVDPNDPEQTQHREGERDDPFGFWLSMSYSDMETASIEAVRAQRRVERAERAAAAERAVGGRLAERPAADEA